jgi:hypothetical protein
VSVRRWGASRASLFWLEAGRAVAGGQPKTFDGAPDGERLAPALATLPAGPSAWVVDDRWMPSLLLRDIMEVPARSDAREAFFRWRYTQHLALEGDQAVQALDLDGTSWLLVGMPQSLREGWLQLATQLGHPIQSLVPRWLWLYNRLAPTREVPGMLLSLAQAPGGGYTGSLAAWGRTLTLLRQWDEPASPETWNTERVLPTAAFLQRESRTPQEIIVWGARDWPATAFATRLLPPEIPSQEAH